MKNPEIKLVEKLITIHVQVNVKVKGGYDETVIIKLGENDKYDTTDITEYLIPNEDYNACGESFGGVVAELIELAYEDLEYDEDEVGEYITTKSEIEADDIETEIKVFIDFQSQKIYLKQGTQMLEVTDYLSTDITSDIFCKYELAKK